MNKKNQEEYLRKRDIILNGDVWEVLLLIALPIAFSNFIQVFYSSIDTYFAGGLGVEVVAGITFSLYLVNFIRSMGMGVCIAGTTIIAKDIGAGNTPKAKDTMTQLFLILFVVSGLLLLIVLPFSKEILYLIGGTDEIMDSSNTYFRLNIISLFFLFVSEAYISIKKALGSVKIILISNLISIIIKWISCYLFINVWGYGVEGLVYSTIMARLLICFMAIYDLIIKKSSMRINLKNTKFIKISIVAIILIGVPIGLEKSALSLGNIILNKISMTFGYEFIAARGIVNKMINLGQSVLTGFAVGITPIISQNIGAGNYQRVKEIISKSCIIASILSVGMYSILRANGEFLAKLFIREESEVALDFIMEGFYIFGFAMFGWSLYQVGMSIFKGFGHTKNNMSISFIRLFVLRIPIVYFLILNTNLAQKGLWIGMLISNALGMVVLWGIIYNKYYKNDKMKIYFEQDATLVQNSQ